MKKRSPLSILAALLLMTTFWGCSGNEKKNDLKESDDKSLYTLEDNSKSEMPGEESEFSSSEEGDLFAASSKSGQDDQEEEKELSSTASNPVPESSALEEEKLASETPVVAPVASESKMESDAVVVADTSLSPSDLSVYRVQEDHETLMLIAFKIYGDYAKWREIAELNKEMFNDRYIIKKGMMLKFRVPAEQFEWNPKGEPYVIIHGDTLSRISSKVYHTIKRWKDIWDNNRPLIKNPNKIFSGFTIYYTDDKGELAKGVEQKDRLPSSSL